MEFSERIAAILKHYNLPSKDLAELCGVQRTAIHHILNGRNRPSVSFLSQLSTAFPEINTRWLLHGRGSMFTSVTDRQNEIVQTPEKTGEEKVKMDDVVETFVKDTFGTTNDVSKAAPEHVGNNKVLPDPVSAVNGEDNVGATHLGKSQKGKVLRSIVLIYEDGTFEHLSPQA